MLSTILLYEVGTNASFLLRLVHVLPFTIMLGSTLDFFFFFFPAHVGTAIARYRALTTFRGDIALHSKLLIVQWISARLMRYLWGQTAFLFDCGRTHLLYYSWCWYYTAHLGAVEIAVTC